MHRFYIKPLINTKETKDIYVAWFTFLAIIVNIALAKTLPESKTS